MTILEVTLRILGTIALWTLATSTCFVLYHLLRSEGRLYRVLDVIADTVQNGLETLASAGNSQGASHEQLERIESLERRLENLSQDVISRVAALNTRIVRLRRDAVPEPEEEEEAPPDVESLFPSAPAPVAFPSRLGRRQRRRNQRR